MCSRYTIRGDTGRLKVPKQRDFDAFADIRLQIRKFRPRFNVSPTQTVPFVRFQEGAMRLGEAKWGLIPGWAKDAKIGLSCLNARGETVHEKPAFRSAFKRRRCVLPADGYYEWTGKPGSKHPWWFVRPNHDLFWFAGLWETWTPEGGSPVESVTIITTAANRYTSAIHDRMPVVLEERDIPSWLDPEAAPEALVQFIRSAPEDYFCRLSIADTVVNSSRNEGEQCIANVSSSPFGPAGQLCVATPMPCTPVYHLPPGLAPGTVVRVLQGEKPGCEVEEVDHPERRHHVVRQLLEPVGKPHGTPSRIWHVAGEDQCDWNQAISERIASIYR